MKCAPNKQSFQGRQGPSEVAKKMLCLSYVVLLERRKLLAICWQDTVPLPIPLDLNEGQTSNTAVAATTGTEITIFT